MVPLTADVRFCAAAGYTAGMSVQTIPVHEADAGIRLDRWFRRHFPQLTQGALQKMLRTGQVRVDGKRAEGNTRLDPGQEVRIPPLPDAPPPAARTQVNAADEAMLLGAVLYRDASVIVLNKPHGLAVQGGPGITRHLDGMLDALRFGAEERPRLVHRLDKDTSGILLLGRSAAAAAALAAGFRGRDAHKTYWAVVVGEPLHAAGRISQPLARERSARGERTVPSDEGQAAVTEYTTLEVVKRRAAWLQMHPLTGRTHQLRVHAASSLNTPILGDGKYGGHTAHMDGLPGALHLHARAIAIPHPEGGVLEAEAGLPPHMAETFAYFGFDAPKPHKPRLRR